MRFPTLLQYALFRKITIPSPFLGFLYVIFIYSMCSSLCQSAIKGILGNMSLLNTRLPGLLPKVECTPALMQCMVINDIPYIFFCISNLSPYILYWQCVPICLAICPHILVLRIFPIVWCILLQIALD
jgi:hypothetical protein